ncbi:MAG: type III secretion system chaperone [Pseudomonadota bacterium]
MPTTEADAFDTAICALPAGGCGRDDVQAVLTAFSGRHGLPAMQLDESGVLALEIGEYVAMNLVHLPHLPGLVASVDLPEEIGTRGDLLRELLEANLSFARTGGGTFAKLATDPDASAPGVQFCKLIPVVAGDDAAFERDLMGFANLAQDWLVDLELALDLAPAASVESAPEAALAPAWHDRV